MYSTAVPDFHLGLVPGRRDGSCVLVLRLASGFLAFFVLFLHPTLAWWQRYAIFSIYKASIDNEQAYNAIDTTPAVDHLRVGNNTRVQGTMAAYLLNIHLDADHAGLCFTSL
jgi:hypothetical protein